MVTRHLETIDFTRFQYITAVFLTMYRNITTIRKQNGIKA